MSTAASLASAKKRRGANNVNQSDVNQVNKKNLETNKKISYYDAFRIHSSMISELKNEINEIKNNKSDTEFITKKDLEITLLESNLNNKAISNKYDNLQENTKEEFSTLKNNIQSLQKTVADMNSIIQSLKATIVTHENEIETLKVNLVKETQQETQQEV